MRRALLLALLFPCLSFAQSAATAGRFTNLQLSGTLSTNAVTVTNTTTATFTSSTAATGSTDVAFVLNASNALSQTAATDSLVDIRNAGTNIFRLWSSARLLMQSQASNQAPGFNIKAGSSTDVYFRLGGGSGEIVQMFANNTSTTSWQLGDCPATNCQMSLGPSAGSTAEIVLYKGTNGPAVKLNVPERHAAYSLPTCASGTERTVASDTLSGGTSTSHASRLCFCQSDGAASPAYAWKNIITGNAGTTTTCPD